MPAMTAAVDLWQANPEVDGIYAMNDEMAMGVLAALRSAGREGSAIADDLIAFGLRKKWKEKLLVASRSCAAQVKKDAASFNRAYDSGALTG